MNLFLKFTAVFEAITGFGLVLFPKVMIRLLFLSALQETGGIMIAMIAGAAILFIALLCWFAAENWVVVTLLKALLFYNIIVAALVVYGIINFPIYGAGTGLIIGFHIILALWSFSILRKTKLLT